MRNDDPAGIGFHETHDVLQTHGLTDAASSDNGYRFSRVNVKIAIGQNRPVERLIHIAELDIVGVFLRHRLIFEKSSPFLGGIHILKVVAAGSGPEQNLFLWNGIDHFPAAPVERTTDARKGLDVPDCRQRLRESATRERQNAHRITGLRRLKQLRKQTGGYLRKIARHDQIPVSEFEGQRRFDAREGSLPGSKVREDRKADVAVSFRRPDQRHVARRFSHHRSDVLRESAPSKGQETFILFHSRARTSNQHEPGASHARIIPSCPDGAALAEQKTLGVTKTYRYNLINKVMRICLVMAGGIVAAQCLVADSAAPDSNREPARGLTSVVRADSKSGRLVRSVVMKRRAVSAEVGFTDIGSIIAQAAQTHDIDPLLVHSMIKVESNYDPFAVSPKGAMGLMQLMPSTARQLGVKNVFDARENIDGGVRYYKYLKGLYNNDDRLALAAYNAGPGAVAKYGRVPPFPETISYVRKVGRSYGKAWPAAVQQPTADEDTEAAPEQEQYSKLVEVVDAEGRIYLRSR